MAVAERIELGEGRIVTMRELSQHTAQVIAELIEKRTPAMVTKHGRFQVVILPIDSGSVEATVLAHLSEVVTAGFAALTDDTAADTVSTADAARELGFAPPSQD